MSKKINKSLILKSAKKIAKDKELLRSYLNGEITLKTLNDKGIRVSMPI